MPESPPGRGRAAVHSIGDLDRLLVAPFVYRAIRSHLGSALSRHSPA